MCLVRQIKSCLPLFPSDGCMWGDGNSVCDPVFVWGDMPVGA